jgi:hypothetical protein
MKTARLPGRFVVRFGFGVTDNVSVSSTNSLHAPGQGMALNNDANNNALDEERESGLHKSGSIYRICPILPINANMSMVWLKPFLGEAKCVMSAFSRKCNSLTLVKRYNHIMG